MIVGQSGGADRGDQPAWPAYKTAKDRGAKKVYGMLHGIQGLLEKRYVDLDKPSRRT